MERIQSAIQKARASRQDKAEAASAPHKDDPVKAPVQSPEPKPDISALWGGLPELKVNGRALAKTRIIVDQVTHDAAPFDTLRTRLLHQMKTNKWRRVAITSPGASCGKTTLSLNLAFSMARRRDLRTMLVDLDMRRPAIAKVLNIPQPCNFADVLKRKAPAEDHMVCYDNRLIFAPNHAPAPRSAELLQERETGWVIDQLEERYQPDLMIFDTPPMLACDDAYAFFDQVDCVLLVAAAESTTSDELEKCEREIAGRTNLLGITLNKCRYLDKADNYGY